MTQDRKKISVERLVVFTIGLVSGTTMGYLIARGLGGNAGYELFRQEETLADAFEAPAGGDDIVAPAAPLEGPVDGGETPLDALSGEELDDLKRLILPRLTEADVAAWQAARAIEGAGPRADAPPASP